MGHPGGSFDLVPLTRNFAEDDNSKYLLGMGASSVRPRCCNGEIARDGLHWARLSIRALFDSPEIPNIENAAGGWR
jgi:hypothetical protein